MIKAKDTAYLAMSDAQRKELKQILEHNDLQSARSNRKVGIHPTVVLLNGLGWTGGRSMLNVFCRIHFGRQGFTSK